MRFANPLIANAPALFQFNSGTPAAKTTNGLFTATGPTAATVSVSGRVTTAQGRGIKNVVITMTDSSGNQRRAQTTSFGYFRFEDVMVGQTFTFTATGKRFSFVQNTQVKSITQTTTNINFVATDTLLSTNN